jgi:hypothetical protein
MTLRVTFTLTPKQRLHLCELHKRKPNNIHSLIHISVFSVAYLFHILFAFVLDPKSDLIVMNCGFCRSHTNVSDM